MQAPMEALTAAGEELVDRAANAYLHVARCGWSVWVRVRWVMSLEVDSEFV